MSDSQGLHLSSVVAISTARRKQSLVLGAVVLAVACLLGYGYYLEHVEYLDPCPLCMTQRLFYYLIAGSAILALFRVRSVIWQKVTGSLLGLSAIGGLAVALRQIWLQHLPPELVPECGPGLEYWLANKPFLNTLQLLFKGDGNCAEVVWTFLGLSIASWSALWFLFFLIVGIWIASCTMRLTEK